MPASQRWRALHAVDDHIFECLEVLEQSNGSFMFIAFGVTGPHLTLATARTEADALFRRRYPTHACSGSCSAWKEAAGATT